jgi:hypothetical protein
MKITKRLFGISMPSGTTEGKAKQKTLAEKRREQD